MEHREHYEVHVVFRADEDVTFKYSALELLGVHGCRIVPSSGSSLDIRLARPIDLDSSKIRIHKQSRRLVMTLAKTFALRELDLHELQPFSHLMEFMSVGRDESAFDRVCSMINQMMNCECGISHMSQRKETKGVWHAINEGLFF